MNITLKNIPQPIVMVGLMGAGKTSVGKLLAKKLYRPFIDSDIEIEKAAGCSVSDIFSIYGEKEFRRGEKKVIERVFSENKNFVLSTGEGAFIIKGVRDIIKKRSISIWLKANLDLLVKRTSLKDTRPLLKNDNPEKILNNLIEQRYETYAEADITVETTDEPTYITVRKVTRAIKNYLKENPDRLKINE